MIIIIPIVIIISFLSFHVHRNQKLEILELSSDFWNHDVLTWEEKRQEEQEMMKSKSKSKWWRTTHSRRYFNSQNLIKKIKEKIRKTLKKWMEIEGTKGKKKKQKKREI